MKNSVFLRALATVAFTTAAFGAFATTVPAHAAEQTVPVIIDVSPTAHFVVLHTMMNEDQIDAIVKDACERADIRDLKNSVLFRDCQVDVRNQVTTMIAALENNGEDSIQVAMR